MNHKESIANFRKDYQKSALQHDLLDENPIKQFENWFNQAVNAPILEPNAMILATVLNGQPSSRVVLLKGFSNQGFVFYTNYQSHKGQSILNNNKVALLFFWDVLERQVRIEGQAIKVSSEQSDEYFAKRPRGSQIGAWISQQSSTIDLNTNLVEEKKQFEAKFEGKTVPRPPHWGGFLVKPNLFEFWQGRSSRLHDRFQYQLTENKWVISRLSP